MMRENARNRQAKETKLLQLYSLWHETHRYDLQKKYLSLLRQVLSCDPSFNPRQKFQIAF